MSLVNGILDLVRIEIGKLRLDDRPFMLGDLSKRIDAGHGPTARPTSIDPAILRDPVSDCPRFGNETRKCNPRNALRGREKL